MFFFT